VAIKVLPARVASDPNLRERFEREGRAVAGLNHPHICTLHDVGRQDGVDFLVMEYLEGQTLADRLANGALPLDKALQYAIQIADALDKAHRAGITHRDYVSNESGRPEIYVQPYPGPGAKRQISTESGTEPVWNRNGRELFYRSGTRLVVEVTTQPTFSAGRPRLVFEGMYLASLFPLTGVAYDVSPDGQRFLMVQEAEQSPSATQINVVLDWFEELKRRVPTAK
jgi:hypothetical protein